MGNKNISLTLLSDWKKTKQVREDVTVLLKPPVRISVSDAAKAALYVREGVKWDPSITPYMCRPMDMTASRLHNIVIFVGPARTGKTLALIGGRYVYTVLHNPVDFAIIHTSQDLARDYSYREIKRMHEYGEEMGRALSGRASDTNTYDIHYKSGIIGIMGWPSHKQLSSRTLPVMLLTDYCRWPSDVGGEGTGFAQAHKRTQTAGSQAMTIAESSPADQLLLDAVVETPHWRLGEPIEHSMPPSFCGPKSSVIGPLFNGGTKEWWYVPCSDCGEFYPQNASIDRFTWNLEEPDPTRAAQDAGTVCCWCGGIHPEADKRKENENGIWLAEGEVIDCYGKVTGDSNKGKTYPSFWLGGGAAAYEKRPELVGKYLKAKQDAEATGDESTLRYVVNNGIGGVYRSIFANAARESSPLMERALPVEKWVVPAHIRFLMAAVDVQGDRFVVQVMGFAPNRNRMVIDRYSLRHTERGENTCRPAVFGEDWDLLSRLFVKSYLLAEDSTRAMMIAGILCDSGGSDGATANAHAYFRSLPSHHKARMRLIKGDSRKNMPILETRYPDSSKRKDRKGVSKGTVPIVFIDVNRVKDRLDGDLGRTERGAGYTEFPDWLPYSFYAELIREKRNAQGVWVSNGRNESWDLMVYAEAAAILGVPFGQRIKGIDRSDFWENPPNWARNQAENVYVIDVEPKKEENKPTTNEKKPGKPFISRSGSGSFIKGRR